MYVNPFDPTLGIAWPAVIGEGEYIMSNGDKNGPNLADARKAWKERNK